jgi:MOSC domain-containing protein YiiM
MRLVSIQVGRPREVEWSGRTVRTSIFKHPIPGPVRVRELNLEGDEQSDLSVHGGAEKAVYAYPSEHYPYWRERLPGVELPWGAFGENLTTEGLSETSLAIGDRLRIGSADFQVTQPRMPCYKLGIRFGDPDMVQRFLESGRSGFYLAVLQEGAVAPGDAIEVLSRVHEGITVADIARLFTAKDPAPDLLRRAVATEALPEGWREHFRKRLRGRAT